MQAFKMWTNGLNDASQRLVPHHFIHTCHMKITHRKAHIYFGICKHEIIPVQLLRRSPIPYATSIYFKLSILKIVHWHIKLAFKHEFKKPVLFKLLHVCILSEFHIVI